MTCFDDDTFDTVISNSVLEHDKFFWKTLSKIRRVTRNGGLVMIGTPGYDQLENIELGRKRHRLSRWLFRYFPKYIPGTPTLHVHNWPGDYYRFSPQAYREVVFEGMEVVEIHSVSIPPRILGVATNVK